MGLVTIKCISIGTEDYSNCKSLLFFVDLATKAMESLSSTINSLVSAQTVSCEIEHLDHLIQLTSEWEPIDLEEQNSHDSNSDACLAQLVNYLFPRRYGWKDNGCKVPRITAEQKQAGRINEILDEIIEW